jgi:hypothetical protein
VQVTSDSVEDVNAVLPGLHVAIQLQPHPVNAAAVLRLIDPITTEVYKLEHGVKECLEPQPGMALAVRLPIDFKLLFTCIIGAVGVDDEIQFFIEPAILSLRQLSILLGQRPPPFVDSYPERLPFFDGSTLEHCIVVTNIWVTRWMQNREIPGLVHRLNCHLTTRAASTCSIEKR